MAVILLYPDSTTKFWTLPSDWNDADNSIEIYAAGGSGAAGTASASGGGGGGGSYLKATNVPLQALLNNNEQGGGLGTVRDLRYVLQSYTFFGYGQVDTDIDFGTPVEGYLFAAPIGGSGSGVNGGVGGNAANAYARVRRASLSGVTSYLTSALSGGSGGTGRASSTAAGAGGGGAAGPNGVGGAGGSNTATSSTVGRGGGGANGGTVGSGIAATAGTGASGGGSGGTGGVSASGAAGSSGTTVYSGGGGGGAADGSAAYAGGTGGNYGGGGGGGGSTAGSAGGAGAPALIVITYSPYNALTAGGLLSTEATDTFYGFSQRPPVLGNLAVSEAFGDSLLASGGITSTSKGSMSVSESSDGTLLIGYTQSPLSAYPLSQIRISVLVGSGVWNLPADWNDNNNIIEFFGAGGKGAAGTASRSGGGGGGGGYARLVNVKLRALQNSGDLISTIYSTDSAGSRFARIYAPGDPFGLLEPSVGGGGSASASSGGIGGYSFISGSLPYGASSLSGVKLWDSLVEHSGGAGGNGVANATAGGSGGGGGGGPNADGASGSGSIAGLSSGQAGGNADGYAGTGGAVTSSTLGNPGSSVNGILSPCGGGGSGAADVANSTAGAGGLFGGGGGGAAAVATSIPATGALGAIRIIYVPLGNSSLIASEAADRLSASMAVGVSGSSIAQDRQDALTASISVYVHGSLGAVDNLDAQISSGSVLIQGYSDTPESTDASLARGSVDIAGIASAAECLDILVASVLLGKAANLNLLEDSDAVTSSGKVYVSGFSTSNESQDTAFVTDRISPNGVLAATEFVDASHESWFGVVFGLVCVEIRVVVDAMEASSLLDAVNVEFSVDGIYSSTQVDYTDFAAFAV